MDLKEELGPSPSREFSVSQRVVGLEMMQTHCSTITLVSDFVDLGSIPQSFPGGQDSGK